MKYCSYNLIKWVYIAKYDYTQIEYALYELIKPANYNQSFIQNSCQLNLDISKYYHMKLL